MFGTCLPTGYLSITELSRPSSHLQLPRHTMNKKLSEPDSFPTMQEVLAHCQSTKSGAMLQGASIKGFSGWLAMPLNLCEAPYHKGHNCRLQTVPYAVLHLGEHVSSNELAGGVIGLVTQLLHLLAVDLQVHIQLLHHSNWETHKLTMQTHINS